MEVKSKRLTCPSCDGALLSTPESGRFKCANCKAEVNLSGGKVQAGTEKVAAELAINRLNQELTALIMQRDQISYQYHQHEANGGAGALVVSVLALIVCWLISVYFFINGSAIGGRVWLLIGVVVAVVILLAIKKSSGRKGDALAASLARDIRQVDRAIEQTKQNIIRNRSIAES